MMNMLTVLSVALAVLDAQAASGSTVLLVPLVAPVDEPPTPTVMVPPVELPPDADDEPPVVVLPPLATELPEPPEPLAALPPVPPVPGPPSPSPSCVLDELHA